jgi:predicted nucleic acid-binding protein
MDWMRAVDESLLYLSILTLGEIRKGAAILPHSKRRTYLESWLDLDVRVRFSGRILAIDDMVADRWGWLTAEAERRGRPLAAIDGLLAATALEHNLTVVSRNTGDFTHTHVPILNPWRA